MTDASYTLLNTLDIFQKNFLRVMKEAFGMLRLKQNPEATNPNALEPKPKPRPRPSPGPPPNSPSKFGDVITKFEALGLPPNPGPHPPAAPSLPLDLPDSPPNLPSGYAPPHLAIQPKPKPKPRPSPRPPPNSPSRYTVGTTVPEGLQVPKARTGSGHSLAPDLPPNTLGGYELNELRNHHPAVPTRKLIRGGVPVIMESEIPMDSRFICSSCVKNPRELPTFSSRYIYKPLSSPNFRGGFYMSDMGIVCLTC